MASSRGKEPCIEWKPYIDGRFKTHETRVEIGKLSVPSDHKFSERNHFQITIHRYSSKWPVPNRSNKPKVHIIFLSGGPGALGHDWHRQIKDLLSAEPGMVAYTLNHRGLQGSGLFTETGPEEYLMKMDSVLKDSPFPISDLTMENAAFDVAKLAETIKASEGDMSDRIRLVLYGFSYGSRLAHTAVSLKPDLFHAAFLAGIPSLGDLPDPDQFGLIQHCQQDDYCRSRMGPNVEKEIKEAISNLANPRHNKCTYYLYRRLNPLISWDQDSNGLSPGEKVVEISRQLSLLLLQNEVHHGIASISASQMAFVFLRATSDCQNFRLYQKRVLPFMSTFFAQLNTKAETADNRSPINSFVNSVIHLNTTFNFKARKERLTIPRDHSDIHPYKTFIDIYFSRWLLMKQYLKGVPFYQESVIKTKRTIIFILQSLMDMTTPPYPAWELYNRVQSPQKGWILYYNNTHDGYWGICQIKLILGVAYDGDLGGMAECIERENKMQPLDWSFEHSEQLRSMWTQVKSRTPSEKHDSSPTEPKLMPFIALSPHIKQRYSALGKEQGIFSSRALMIVGSIAIALLLVGIAIYIYIFQTSKSPRRNQ